MSIRPLPGSSASSYDMREWRKRTSSNIGREEYHKNQCQFGSAWQARRECVNCVRGKDDGGENGTDGAFNLSLFPRLSYVSKREGCCELQTGLHPPNDLLSVRKCRKRPCTRSFPGNIHSKLDISV
jgi:hypothetical protein